MFSNNRNAYRNAFYLAWEKHLHCKPLNAQEAEIIKVQLIHPEYQHLFTENVNQSTEFYLEENPFIHMGLHLAVREQIHINKPNGIKEIYHSLLQTLSNVHAVEHELMKCLANLMWQAQQTGTMPTEAEYLETLRGSRI